MMKRLFLLVSFLFIPFASKSNFPINLCGGVGDFKIDEATFRDVRNATVNGAYGKHWDKGEWILIGNFVKELYFEDLGIKFTFTKKRRVGLYYLTLIQMYDRFTGKTPNGNGIGSDYYDIVKELGQNRILGYNSNGITYYSMHYTIKQNENCYISIVFTCRSVRNANVSNFIVDSIYID